MALLYLVTEKLLVEAHEQPDSPLISAMFFVGFLGLLLLDEAVISLSEHAIPRLSRSLTQWPRMFRFLAK